MKNLLLEHRLKAAQDMLAPELVEIAADHVKEHATIGSLVLMRRRMDAALERALLAQQAAHVARNVIVELDPDGRMRVAVTVQAWDHDCPRCDYLGRRYERGPDAELFDLYTCDRHTWVGNGHRVFVARYGDDVTHYRIATAHALGKTAYFHPALFEARRRWGLPA